MSINHRERAEGLFKDAKIAAEAKRWDKATEFFSLALELIVGDLGELHPDTCKFYLEYGKALLESSKADKDVFAKIAEDHKQNNVGDKETTSEEQKKPESESPTVTSESPTEKSESVASVTADSMPPRQELAASAPVQQPATAKSSKLEVVQEDEPAKPATDEEKSDLVEERELAWEMLESTRIILKKNATENATKIADVHTLLGDVAMEDGNFDRAYEEYTEAIKLFGKSASKTLADRRLASAHQLAGVCALYDQQMEAGQFHYTAAAECFNNILTEILVKEGIMERPEVETEDIEFVDEGNLKKLEEKVGAESALYKEAMELSGIVDNLIERVNDIADQMEEDMKNPEMSKIVQELGQKLASQVASAMAGGGAQEGFDKPSASSGRESDDTKQVNSLGTFGSSGTKRKADSAGVNGPNKIARIGD